MAVSLAARSWPFGRLTLLVIGVLATFVQHVPLLFVVGVALPESPGIFELFSQVKK